MGAYEVNAYYNASTNNTGLPAGILQPPFFGPGRSVAANLGGIGMVIGHELTHGFDDQGAEFDGEGNRADWWAPADKAAFASKGQCVSKQYSSFEVLPGKFVNGDLTLGENIADLGGVKMALLCLPCAARRRGADRRRRLHRGPAVLPGRRPGLVRQVHQGRADQPPDDRRPLAAQVPRLRRAAQPAGVRRGVELRRRDADEPEQPLHRVVNRGGRAAQKSRPNIAATVSTRSVAPLAL
jgi:hypothetical protein